MVAAGRVTATFGAATDRAVPPSQQALPLDSQNVPLARPGRPSSSPQPIN
jgi:hypothetical protein